ncbi:MAG: Uma2 family endonuclease [Betaproteobacteria bacterium]|nr:Uma2 family endonuclease [Betaproteobacteria bacterium]
MPPSPVIARETILIALDSPLRGTPCQILGPEVYLRADPDAAGHDPELLVVCRSLDPSAAEIGEAKLVIEVLSPSTEKRDRGDKWIGYQKIAVLQDYVLVPWLDQALRTCDA